MIRPEPPHLPPAGWRWTAQPDRAWRLAGDEGRCCRMFAGRNNPACGKPAVAALLRRGRRHDVWWHYCRAHLYGRWVEGDRVLAWILREGDK